MPIFGGDVSADALGAASKLIGEEGVVYAVFVLPVPSQLSLEEGLEEEEAQGRSALESARIKARRAGIKIHTGLIRTRNPGSALVEEAERVNADVIYWSTIHAPLGEQGIGPTATYLLAKRPCRVIIETENRPPQSASALRSPPERLDRLAGAWPWHAEADASPCSSRRPVARRAPLAALGVLVSLLDRRDLDAARLPAQARRARPDAGRRLPAGGRRRLGLLGARLRCRDGGSERRRLQLLPPAAGRAASRSPTAATGSGSPPSSRSRRGRAARRARPLAREELEERRREADLASELAQLLLGAERLRDALEPASRRLAQALGVEWAEIRLVPSPPRAGAVVLALRAAGAPAGTLELPGTVTPPSSRGCTSG